MKKEEILKLLFSFIPQEQIVFVIWYGNKKGRDVDLFVVLKNNVNCGSIFVGVLDIGYIGSVWIPMMIKNHDPIITDPLLTGEVIYGEVSLIKYDLLTQESDDDIVIYLLQCAEIFYEWAVNHAFENRLREALFTLTFVHSYILYAFKYFGDSNIVAFKDLLSNNDGLLITKNTEKAKKKKHILESDVYQSFTQTRKVLTDLKNILLLN
jgi:hypothetical protein